MKKLPQGKKYLETIVNSLAPQEADQLLAQRLFKETNCNFSAYQFRSASGQVYSQTYLAYHQVQARSTSQ